MKNSDIIESLLERESLCELNDNEQNIVIREFGSLDNFESARKVHFQIKSEFNQDAIPEPSSAVKDSLDAILHARNSASRVRVWQKRMPIYQTVAACLAVVAITFAIKPQPEVQFRTKELTQTKFIDRIIKDTVRIVQTKFVKIIPDEISVNTSEQDFADNSGDTSSGNSLSIGYARNQFVGLDNLKLIENQRKGISLAEDTMLMNIRITRY